MYATKRASAINSGYSSRNSTQPDCGIAKGLGTGTTGLSSKVPTTHAGDNQRSNDYLRLKRVNTNMMNNLLSNQGSNNNTQSGVDQNNTQLGTTAMQQK